MLGLTLIGALPAACGGGSGEVFLTSIPGNAPLGSLSGAQATELCNDEMRFTQQPSFKMDLCHEGAVLGVALTASFSPDLTDAELQAACTSAYTSCLHPDGGAGATQSCTAVPPNCTATVSDLVSCLDEDAAATRALAAQLPDCGSITRASLTATDGGTTSSATSTPAACQTLQQKCSGASSAAQSFAQVYCALVEPCCAASHSSSGCENLVLGAAGSYTFDQCGRPPASPPCRRARPGRGSARERIHALQRRQWVRRDSGVRGRLSVGEHRHRGAGTALQPGRRLRTRSIRPCRLRARQLLVARIERPRQFLVVITTKLSDPGIGTASPSQSGASRARAIRPGTPSATKTRD